MNSVLKHEALKSSPGRDYITEIPTNRIKANPYQPGRSFREALFTIWQIQLKNMEFYSR